jgi:predicted dehydrogenase
MARKRFHRVAIVGYGDAGFSHLAAWRALAEVGVVCDSDPVAVQRACSALSTNAVICHDYRDVAADPSVDIVSICTPDHLHGEPAIAMIEAGKHVFIEKPVATSLEDLSAISQAVSAARRSRPHQRIVAIEKYCYSPRNLALRGYIEAGVFGKISTVEGSYIHNGSRSLIVGGWRGRGCYNAAAGGAYHSIALLQWLMRKLVRRVSALASCKAFAESEMQDSDTVTALLDFGEGTVGVSRTMLGVDGFSAFERTVVLEIIGTTAMFVTGMGSDGDMLVEGKSRQRIPIDREPTANQWPEFNQGLFNGAMRAFLSYVDDGEEPTFSLQEAVYSSAVCIAIYESARANGLWIDVPRVAVADR